LDQDEIDKICDEIEKQKEAESAAKERGGTSGTRQA
jgi:hypothetical protein